MRNLILLRLALLPVVLLGAVTVVFVLIQLAPGDPTAALLGPNASDATREALRIKLGLYDPLPIQYIRWIERVVRGDLGLSITLRVPVTAVIVQKLGNTLILGIASGIFGVLLGVAAGIASAVRQNSFLDRSILGASLLALSMPAYWLSLVLIYVFAVSLRWFPTGRMYSLEGGTGFLDLLWHLVLPAIAAAPVAAAVIARVTRTALLDVIRQDFVTTLRARGLPERTILYRHVLRNALPGIVTMSGLQVGYLLLGSALFVEIVFSWPGIGLQTYEAVGTRDMPMIVGIVLLSTVLFVTINLVVDIVSAFLNPRTRG